MNLSILDFVTVYEGVSDTDTMDAMLKSVVSADDLGFSRYWFTEHHSMASLLSSAPELMIARALSVSKRIKLGAGGIMLPNHSALKVAENFRLLSIMAPGRIDLGLGRAPGTNQETALALSRSQSVMMSNDFGEQLSDLNHYLNHDFSSAHPFSTVQLPGKDGHNPEIFMLGSSRGGVEFALKHNLSFVFAGHISPQLMSEVLTYYNQNKSSDLKSIAAIGVVCAESDEEAKRLAEPYIHMWVMRMMGNPSFTRLSVEDASAYVYSQEALIYRSHVVDKILIGSVETLSNQFQKILDETAAEEIMMVDCYPNLESKLEGYRLISSLLK